MNSVEIILNNVEKEYIEKVFFDTLEFDITDKISSHFYDETKKIDMEYQDVKSLNKYFNMPGTCNIRLKKVVMGVELKNILIIISCDERYGDITIDFDEEQFEKVSVQEIENKFEKLMTLLLKIYEDGKIEGITIGYEPTDDEDMKVVEIGKNKIKVFNEDIFKSSLALILYSIAKKMCYGCRTALGSK